MTEPDVIDQVHVTADALAVMVKQRPALPEEDRRVIEGELRRRAARISDEGNMHHMESILACQADLLHHMFTHAVSKYATSSTQNDGDHHSNIALRAQLYCRMTVNTLNTLITKGMTAKHLQELNNELLRYHPHAPLDRRTNTASAGTNPLLAAMEEKLRAQNNGG
jgi:hypothetical protein